MKFHGLEALFPLCYKVNISFHWQTYGFTDIRLQIVKGIILFMKQKTSGFRNSKH